MNNLSELKKLKDIISKGLWAELKRHNCFLAGGALVSIYNNNNVNDLDIYVKDKATAFQITEWLSSDRYTCMSKTNKSIIMCKKDETPVNIIIFKYFNSLQEIFDTFDFTCCMGGFDFEKEEFQFHPDFFKDNLTKQLVYSKLSNFPIGALLRVKKYNDKGFNISRTEMTKIALHCTQLKLETIEDLEAQINGMYGIEIKDIYGKDLDNFNVPDFLDRLEAMTIELENKTPKPILDWDQDPMWDGLFSYTKINGMYYRVIGKEIIGSFYPKDHNLDEKDLDLISVFPLKLYKWVKKDPKTNNLVSFYKNNFEYVPGKIVSDLRHGIHCVLYRHKESATYAHNQDAVLLELIIDKPEDIRSSITDGGIGTTIYNATVGNVIEKSNKL